MEMYKAIEQMIVPLHEKLNTVKSYTEKLSKDFSVLNKAVQIVMTQSSLSDNGFLQGELKKFLKDTRVFFRNPWMDSGSGKQGKNKLMDEVIQYLEGRQRECSSEDPRWSVVDIHRIPVEEVKKLFQNLRSMINQVIKTNFFLKFVPENWKLSASFPAEKDKEKHSKWVEKSNQLNVRALTFLL